MKGSEKFFMKKLCVWCMLLVLLCGMAFPGHAALVESKHPLIDPQEVPHVETEDVYFNLLISGIDYGKYTGRWASGNKNQLDECHTDVVMVVSINKTKGKMNLISIPRDSVTYVPGIHGIYKLNAAFNCAETLEEGMQRTCDAVTWHLGGIPIHKYIAVDMASLIAMGDAIGGVDFDMDMTYTGGTGKIYRKGMQHLDGLGIIDYVRARKNATLDANDIGRTRRGRDMMIAVFDKVQQIIKEEGMGSILLKMVNIMFGGEYNVLTNLTRQDMMTLATLLTNVGSSENIGSHVLTGRYLRDFEHWNFTFNDQAHRQQVLKETFGIDAQPIPYVGRGDAQWLVDDGFGFAKNILVAKEVYLACAAVENPTATQREALKKLEDKYALAVQAFETAAESHVHSDNVTAEKACASMRSAADDVAEAFDYQGKMKWSVYSLWYKDAYINEYNQINWN